MFRSIVAWCPKRKRNKREKTIDGVRYCEVPGYEGYMAGEDGSVWSGDLDRPKSDWYRPKPQKRRNTIHLYAMINWTEVGQGTRKLGELVLRAFGRPPTEKNKYLAYRDGNPENLRPENLYWTERPLRSRKAKNDETASRWRPRGSETTPGVKVIPLIWGNETQMESNHASQDNGTANPPHHLPDR